MPVAYVLQPPNLDTTILFPVTFVLSGCTLVTKEGGTLIPHWREFASAEAARAHLDDVIRARKRVGYTLVETREVEEEIAPEQLGSDLTIVLDVAGSRMTAVFHKSPSAETLDTMAARLRKHEPLCLRIMPPFAGWSWSQLATSLLPSLEAFIFDSESISRQSFNTLGDIADVLEACPMLKRALICGCSTMRKTRHEHLRELCLLGSPLDSSVMIALVASQLPALEKLVLFQEKYEFRAVDLAKSLRSIEAPRLSQVYVHGVSVLDMLTATGTAALPWNLCIIDSGFDDVDGLLEVLKEHDALRSGKLRLHSDKFFNSEIAQLKEMGVIVEDMNDAVFGAYSAW
ncbi:MAG TPA: hypothetical protein VKC66_05640 [Xanthobacteraceae bacterium]|nr:hypothetical protein [Xanthobacteraceae bacterium]